MRVRYFTLSRRRDVLPTIKEIKKYFSTMSSLIPVGEPLALTGNHAVLICKAPFSVLVKIDGQKRLVYAFKYILEQIHDSKIQESDDIELQQTIITYK